MKTLLAFVALTICCFSYSQDYPVKPIRLVVPYSPGGPVDIVGRIVAQKLTPALSQQDIVDNRAGGGGNLAVEIVAKSAADGYTLLMGANGTNAINPGLYPHLAVDPARELAPITMIASSPMILVVHPTLSAHSVKEFVALAKSVSHWLLVSPSQLAVPSSHPSEQLPDSATVPHSPQFSVE
jgi:tripartite-type tricarboxylate transporter receptor subunit TctC